MNHSLWHRAFALLLVFAAAAMLAVPAAAYNNAGDWAVPTLKEADLLGILPEELEDADMKSPITRGEMCCIAVAAYEKLSGNSATPNSVDYFNDTEDPKICAAHEIGLVDGYPDGSFQPDRTLSRQEFFKILSNLNKVAELPLHLNKDYLESFSDRGSLGSWAESATQEVVALNLVSGTTIGGVRYLQPENDTSRQEAVAMFLRGFKNADEFMQTKWLTEAEVKDLEAKAQAEASSSEAAELVKYALTFVGKPYVFGANGPNSFDCSGFTKYVYAHFGYSINRVANDQVRNGKAITFEQLRPGDLVCFANTYSSGQWITHVGIYIGEGRIVHAANTTRGVTVDTIRTGYYRSHYAAARRILP